MDLQPGKMRSVTKFATALLVDLLLLAIIPMGFACLGYVGFALLYKIELATSHDVYIAMVTILMSWIAGVFFTLGLCTGMAFYIYKL
jgi:hypothetical protein